MVRGGLALRRHYYGDGWSSTPKLLRVGSLRSLCLLVLHCWDLGDRYLNRSGTSVLSRKVDRREMRNMGGVLAKECDAPQA